MNEEYILKRIEEVFQEVLEIKNFNEDLSMEVVPEWDSLKHLQLLVAVEKTFGIEIEFQKSLKMTSVKGMTEIISYYINK
ncbi:MAG: hypothetical protein ACD_51C00326G0003 [uncultured bacterium]|nr:MAG: hypothetical protein ACD_51C00326G0003 [uncultured bacterium]